MKDLLDAISELAYVVDIVTYELLYMNATGKEQFKVDSLEGRKCYEVLQGRNTPCEFCTTPFLEIDRFYSWEITNPLTNRHYLLKDKLLPWNGKLARIEIAFDLTDKQESLKAETLLINCTEILYLSQPFSKSAESILPMLGNFFKAERAYIFELEGAKIKEVFEWLQPGLAPVAEMLQGVELTLPLLESVWGKHIPATVYPLPESASEPQPKSAVHIMVAGSVAVRMPHLHTVLKTLANFMTYTLRVERYQTQLERLSFVDALTGVLNRNAYVKDMELPFHAGQPIGVVQVSVNGIKSLNDRKSREYGDHVLIKTAQRLQSILTTAKVYRIGGDEFIAVWKNVDGRVFEEGIRGLREWQNQKMTVKCALGYQWVSRCSNLQELTALAEERMYQDKKKFYRSMALPERYRPSNDKVLSWADGDFLNRMIEEQRFVVYFQPKFSVSGHELIGAEALIRFLSGAGQILPPDQFIPFLEEARLIDRVDFYVFQFVCAKITEWLAAGKPVVPISVNFSRYTIKEPWFHDRLLKTWEKFQIPKKYIELEITEGSDEDGDHDILGLLSLLRRDGFPVSIDDFGVKYANLSIFTNGDFSTLKVDKSLIGDWENPRTKEILRVLCDICRSTKVCLIAEGVEQVEQMDFLEQIHCDGVQGFLFSYPLPLREYEQLYLEAPANEVSDSFNDPHKT